MMARDIFSTYCALCISRCGCLATVEDGKLVRVAADHSHPTGRAICIKAKVAPELVAHPDRLTTPLLRTNPKGDPNPGWRSIGWDEALRLLGQRLTAAGPESTAFAVTTPSGTAIADSFDWILRLVHIWGSPNLVFATENCNWHRDFSPALTWGRNLGMPDYAHTKTILLWGSNPVATWLAHAERIRAAQRRGANLIVVDPRKSGLANGADIWLAVRPGTDAALALGLIHLLLEEGGADLDFLRQHSDAFSLCPDGHGTVLERLVEHASLWPPERVAAATAVSEELASPHCYAACLRTRLQLPNSLLAGKKQGISAKIGVFGRLTSRKRAAFQCITDEIPYAQEQGIFLIPAGNIRERSGILSGSILAFYRFLGPRMRHRVRSRLRGEGISIGNATPCDVNATNYD